MSDEFYIYRPLLDLIGRAEGTDKERGYDETLAYGAYTGGPVDLTHMTLEEVDRLQTGMLRHPKNKFGSSAVGRYQIVRTTLRHIRKNLGLPGSAVFSPLMQDRCACFLLGSRGIDEWLAGRKSANSMLLSLAQEWASFPTPNGKGYYGGQRAAISPGLVMAILEEVHLRSYEQTGIPPVQSGQPEPLPQPTPPEPEPNWFIRLINFLFGTKE